MANRRAEWGEGRTPLSCRSCYSSERKHWGKGLCTRCYQRPGLKEQFGPLTEWTADDMVDAQASGQDFGTLVSPDGDDDLVGGGYMGEDSPVAASPFVSGERPPGSGLPSPPEGTSPGSSTKKAGIFGRFKKDRTESVTAPPTKEKRPGGKVAGKRISGAETIADVWGGAGGFLVRNPSHVPLGRYMQFQAPVAGEMIDEAVKGSIVDKVALQRIVKARGRFDLIGAVFGPPALIYAIERDPSRAEVLMPMLQSSIRNALPLMVPAIKKVKAKAIATQQAAEDLFEGDPEFAAWATDRANRSENADPAEYIMNMIFGGWAPPSTVQSEPESMEVVVR